ncbi:type VI secretion system protein TssA [Paraburkholderia panacisoli]|uniref:Type VI secretion system protein TssA n=1 Tax=Paraburkholderia panacisoli TaxID=2603818 RepID=A0A5B0GCF7_9BURK|nr:type VI secretion system protein TssA [Paraburkholderia panacisoli]KAA1000976.1 type VI secretion system protein TssA [Paraburkholderia panacisoli]
MNQADSAAWLTDLTTDLPCGEDEEYSAEFRALEQAVTGKPDAQYGDTVIPATPPDWAEALSLASALLARSRDLRVAVHYTRAALMREGFSGLERGLGLIEGLLETRWDTVHPQLDPNDQNDPTARVNAMSGLIDGAALPADLRDVPFIVPRGQHGITLRHVELATGEQQQDGADVPSQEAIDAAFALTGLPQVEAALAAVRGSLASVSRIEALLTERVGPARALDFTPLARVLARIAEVVTAHVPAKDVQGDVAADEYAGTAAAITASTPGHPAAAFRSTQIASGQDVIDALDRICTYYAQHEPSSPLPVLLQRARRLVGKSFIEIVEDVAPDGVGQFRHLGGVA